MFDPTMLSKRTAVLRYMMLTPTQNLFRTVGPTYLGICYMPWTIRLKSIEKKIDLKLQQEMVGTPVMTRVSREMVKIIVSDGSRFSSGWCNRRYLMQSIVSMMVKRQVTPSYVVLLSSAVGIPGSLVGMTVVSVSRGTSI